jgi:3-oxoacyl-[acyl-carrier-protein] synthase II
VKREFQLSGPSTNVVAACATGVAALETAAQWIELGLCDVALAGASESSLGDFYRAGFQQMGVLAGGSAENVRPFDTSRSGFAMGEGAAVMVLESEERARARGHAPLARLEKITLRHNPEDIISFDESGVHVERLIRATVNKTRPGYVNAHGTGTRLNDLVEARGLARAFGDDVAHIPVSSTKAATGHLLGAAGAVEAALCVLALRDGKIPPTVHLTDPDPACAFDAVRGGARSQKIDSALSLSYGFGGQMGAVLFSRV